MARFRRLAWSGLSYLILACAAYLPILLKGSFLCDDFVLLTRVKRGLGIWDYHGADFYRPGISTTLHLLWRLFGPNPFPYHLFNILVLVATGLILQEIWQTLTGFNSSANFQRSGFVVGLVFVLWITHSESVSWISGMTDGVAVFFGAAALLAFILHRGQPTILRFAMTFTLLWLGLLCKEAIVTYIPICLVFGFILFPSRKQRLMRLGEAGLLLGMGVVYVFWRKHVIGQLVGGYGTTAHLDFSWHGITGKLTRHLANAFLPFNKMVALWEGANLATLLTMIASVGLVTLLLRKSPKPKPTPKWVQLSLLPLLLLGLVRLAFAVLPDYLFDQFLPQMLLTGLVLFTLAVTVCLRSKRAIALDSGWVFVLVSLLAIVLHANTMNLWHEFFLLTAYLWFAYATRPMGNLSVEDKLLLKVGWTSFAATLFAILPTITLRVGFSGEASRFSYGPSLFSTVALACVALLYLPSLRIRVAFAISTLIVSGLLLYENNVPWAIASEVSNSTSRAIKSVLPARRIYVLTAPGAINAAFVFRIGIEHLPEVLFDDRTVQVHPAKYLVSCADGDRVVVKPDGPNSFDLAIVNNKLSNRFESCYLQPAELDMTTGWFNFPLVGKNAKTLGVQLDGYQSQSDHVIVIDGQSARVIR